MSEMVERVARVLSIADGNHPEACSNDGEETPAWTLYVDDARTAIEAMREPTKDMQNAGFTALDYHADCHCDHNDVWREMINAALK